MDTNATLAATAERVKRGEVSPGAAQALSDAIVSIHSDRRAQRKVDAAWAIFRSELQDAAAIASPATAQMIHRALGTIAEHVPPRIQFDAAMRRQAAQA